MTRDLPLSGSAVSRLPSIDRPLSGSAVSLLLPIFLLLSGSAFAQGVNLPLEQNELAGAIAGRVCRDLDFDGECAPTEPGITGVRLVLETGHAVLTDSNGRYHFAAVDSRRLSAVRPLQDPQTRLPGFESGRHRLKLDRRSLPAGARLQREGITVEVPLAGIVLQHFAVQIGRATPKPLVLGYEGEAPETRLEEDRLQFEIAGMAAPGAQVKVGEQQATVDEAGRFRALVPLTEGTNRLQLKIRSRDGTVQLFAQDVELVRRPSGLLVIPREPRPLATFELPEDEAPTGRSTLPVTGPPGTKVRLGETELSLDASGRSEIPVSLPEGRSQLALTITPPGAEAVSATVDVDASPRPFAVGLLEVELGFVPGTGQLVLGGQGGLHAEHQLGAWALSGELSLQEPDFGAFRREGLTAIARSRAPERFDRWLDPERYPWIWGDDSVSSFGNPSEGRLRLKLEHERYGFATLGTHRATLGAREVGQYHRALFGPAFDLRAPINEHVELRAQAFAAPGLSDPSRPVASLPAHEEFWATGGSLFYLRRTPVVEGAERIRIEVRDSTTDLVLTERVLTRGRDYELDPLAGRIILREPLSFAVSGLALTSDVVAGLPQSVLVVDYAYVVLSGNVRAAGGGEVGAALGPVTLQAGGVEERLGGDRYRLLRAGGAVELFGMRLAVEAARSRGQSLRSEAMGVSYSGGLERYAPATSMPGEGEAIQVRLRGRPFNRGGHVDAVFQRRSRGFSDDAHLDASPVHQLALRADQPIGPVTLGLEASQHQLPDLYRPFGETLNTARVLGGAASVEFGRLALKLEGRDLEITDHHFDQTGGRTSLGVAGRFTVNEELALVASHRQTLGRRGEGPAAFDDTFVSVGAEFDVGSATRVGVRGGVGPQLGPLGFFNVLHQRGEETFYGGYSVDVDGPDVGSGRAVSGARTEAGDGTTAFVEDVTGTSYDAVRQARAVGLTRKVDDTLTVGARFERGAVFRVGTPHFALRTGMGLDATWTLENVLLYGKVEQRQEGDSDSYPVIQRLLLASGEWRVSEALTVGGRFQFGDTQNSHEEADPVPARFLEGGVGLAWRPGPFIGIVRYSITAGYGPNDPLQPRGADLVSLAGMRKREVLSLMPALRLGRFTLAAGGHAGWTTWRDDTSRVLSVSLRPSVQVVGGLELAAEVARRNAAPDGGELSALRGEVAYALSEQARLGLGYTVFGFSGTGVVDEGRSARVYLRAELAY